jgi:hypothetical protein
VKILQDALRKTGASGVPDNGVMDEATKAALQAFMRAAGIEGQRITFQVLERLDIVETLFPKRRIDTQRQ